MATTPQTNTTLECIAEALKDADNIVIAGHIAPDGDCLGSQLCLANALRQLGKKVIVSLACDAPVDESFSFLQGFDTLTYGGLVTDQVDTFVAVDVPTHDRMGEAQWSLHEKASLAITIDHHAVESCMADLSYTDPDSASASMLVWHVVNLLGIEITPEIATCAYTGLLTDTGSFRNQNADENAFIAGSAMVHAGANAGVIASKVFQNRSLSSLKLEALVVSRMRFAVDGAFVISYLKLDDMDSVGAKPADADDMVETLRSIGGVRVACMLKEVQSGDGVFVKGSFRAKDDTNVQEVAQRHNGGGHRAAAGFKMFVPLHEAVGSLIAEFEEILGA